ncbi:hypothetical protein F4780DRAFT_478412 [Xylariomycetidae sp. FL0641]|nr:hypothetical protein F4780DRAFT_478412 [Xylariomycetidae sp. FL0641]
MAAMESIIWRRAIRAPVRAGRAVTPIRLTPAMPYEAMRLASSAPTVMHTSFWKSLIPKPFRRRFDRTVEPGIATQKKPKTKEWNPATFYIVIFLFIGSMAIQMIALRKEFETFTRRAEVRISLLREVIGKLQRGEKVDVEKALGTGDAEQEKEWAEVLRELERDEVLKKERRLEREKKESRVPIRAESSSGPTGTDNPEAPKVTTGSYSNFF